METSLRRQRDQWDVVSRVGISLPARLRGEFGKKHTSLSLLAALDRYLGRDSLRSLFGGTVTPRVSEVIPVVNEYHAKRRRNLSGSRWAANMVTHTIRMPRWKNVAILKMRVNISTLFELALTEGASEQENYDDKKKVDLSAFLYKPWR